MRKIDVHKKNIELFGYEHVNKQTEFFSEDYKEAYICVKDLLKNYGIFGLRFDRRPDDRRPNIHLPYYGGLTSTRTFVYYWVKHVIKDGFSVLICEHVKPKTQLLNYVAQKIDDEHIMVEYSYDPVPQRHMYDKPENLKIMFLGSHNCIVFDGYIKRCFNPEYTYKLGFDVVYSMLCSVNLKEITGTVFKDGRVIVW